MGEIGQGLKKVLLPQFECVGVDKDSDIKGLGCEFLNICIPYSDKFVEIVNDYIKKFKPDLTIVHSTVAVGTTKKLNGNVVHSPVMAKHPNIELGLRNYKKFIGYNNKEDQRLVMNYLGACFRICLVEDSNATELMKILSLTRYGIYLYVADIMNKACEKYEVDYDDVVKLWEEEYNAGLKKLEPNHLRPIYNPPNGKIGGHCVLPVMKMFNEQFTTGIVTKVLGKYHA